MKIYNFHRDAVPDDAVCVDRTTRWRGRNQGCGLHSGSERARDGLADHSRNGRLADSAPDGWRKERAHAGRLVAGDRSQGHPAGSLPGGDVGRLADADQGQRGRFANGEGCERNRSSTGRQQGDGVVEPGSIARRLADTDGRLAGDGHLQPGGQHRQQPENGRAVRLGNASGTRGGRHARAVPGAQGEGERQRVEPGCVADQPVDAGTIDRLAHHHHHHHHQGLAVRSFEDDGSGVVRREGSTVGAHGAHDRSGDAPRFWDAYDIVHCTDGKTRRFEPGSFPLASGISNRVGRLRAYGNAINPQIAAQFIKAYLDTKQGAY